MPDMPEPFYAAMFAMHFHMSSLTISTIHHVLVVISKLRASLKPVESSPNAAEIQAWEM